MNYLDRLAEIFAGRTKAPWAPFNKEDCWRVYGARYPIAKITLSYETPATDEPDAIFIALSGSIADEILAVVRAAENYTQHKVDKTGGFVKYDEIIDTLAALKAAVERVLG